MADVENNQGRQLLSAALRQGVKDAGLSIKDVAKTVGVSDSTLRGMLYKNKFPEAPLLKLARILGDSGVWEACSLAELKEKYEFEVQQRRVKPRNAVLAAVEHAESSGTKLSLSEALRALDDKVRDFASRTREFEVEVHLLIRAMRQGDVFFYTSLTAEPYEWDRTKGFREVGDEIARAVRDGACFVYFTPCDELRIELEDKAQVDGILEFRRMRTRFEEFRDTILKKVSGKNTSRPQEKSARSRLVHVPWLYSAFMAPGHKFMLLQPKEVGAAARSCGSFPVGGEISGSPVNAPLDQQTTRSLDRCIRACIQTAAHEPPSGSDGNDVRELFERIENVEADQQW